MLLEGPAGLDTLLAESTPDEQLGVVFGAVYTTLFAGQLVAYLAATPLIIAFGARTTFVVSGIGMLLVLGWTRLLLPAPGHDRSRSITAR